MLLTSSIPNLVNGISQQPFALRLSSQAERQVNMYSSVVDGMSHRPGTDSRAKLDTEDWSDAFLHTINRDQSERYVMVVRDNDLKVFDAFTGEEQSVSFPDGKSYLASTTPAEDFRSVTVADFTFIVNRSKTVTMLGQLSPAPENEALVFIKGGNYGRTYRIYLDDALVAEYETPNGSSASDHPPLIDTGHIANELTSELIASLTTGWTVNRYGDVIRIRKSDPASFSIRVEDGSGGINISTVYQQTQRFSDLPPDATEDFNVEVVGDNASGFDNYHVRFETGGTGKNSGVWKETLKGGEAFRFDGATMPHTLIRNPDGTFTFKQAGWSDRDVGDRESIPDPSFVGRRVSDVFFYRNRLGFIADENVILSRSGGFFNFWRTTSTILIDSDPIDVAVSHVKVSILNHAVPFNQNLLLFSDQTQFIMDGGDILTPTSVSIGQATEFESSPEARPVGVGQFIYFPVIRGSYSGLREFFVDGQTATNDANDVTSHCPRYLPKDIFKLAVSTSEDTMVALSKTKRDRLWVYKYYIGNQEKLQSSWSEWRFGPGDRILNADFIESTLFLVIARDDGTYLETMDIESGAADEGADFLYRMDRKVYEDDLTTTFDGIHTTFTLPYAEGGDMWMVVRPGDPNYPAGLVIQHERVSPTELRVEGNWADVRCMVGRKIFSEYEFSTFVIKTDEQGGGQSSVGEGRLQILYLAIEYSRSGYFEVHVHPQGRNPTVKKFTGSILSSPNATVGKEALETGRIKFPVYSRNTQVKITIKTDSFLPAYFMSAEWEGRYTTRSRRM